MLFERDIFSFFHRFKSEQVPWWIEIKTDQPTCTYYFGPYSHRREAADQQQGFLEDLRLENAVVIHMEIKQGQPEQLTTIHDDVSR